MKERGVPAPVTVETTLNKLPKLGGAESYPNIKGEGKKSKEILLLYTCSAPHEIRHELIIVSRGFNYPFRSISRLLIGGERKVSEYYNPKLHQHLHHHR